MIHYNSNNNAYCRAVNAETFQTIEHNPVCISILLCTRNPYSYSHFEIVICIYLVRGDIGQMSTNTSRYTICSTLNVYIFVYILIETRIAPLTGRNGTLTPQRRWSSCKGSKHQPCRATEFRDQKFWGWVGVIQMFAQIFFLLCAKRNPFKNYLADSVDVSPNTYTRRMFKFNSMSPQ